jgi:ACS family hexuronate transporter-like MFS transporter
VSDEVSPVGDQTGKTDKDKSNGEKPMQNGQDMTSSRSEQTGERATRFRFTIIGMLFLMAVVNYVDRGALSYTSEHLIKQYGFSKAEWGSVLGYFGYGYMFGAVLGGTLSDRLGPRKVWIYAGLIWSLFEIATAYAGDIGIALLGGSALTGFATIRILFGFAEGPAFSTINKSVSNWAAPRERALLSSLTLASTPVGAMITAPISVALLLLTGDWRLMFVAVGLVSLAMVLLFAFIFTDRPEQSPRVNSAELAKINEAVPGLSQAPASEEAARPSWFGFFASRTLIFNTVGYFAFLYITFLLLTWTPKYLQDQFHYNLASLWYVGMIPWLGSCLTVVIGGRISDRILAITGSLVVARSWFAAGSFLLAGLCFLVIPWAESAVGVIALMTVANALNTLPNAVYWTVVIDTSPRSRTGTNSGIMHLFAATASIIAPTLTGYLVSIYGYNSMFIAAGVVMAIGMLSMLMVRPGEFRSSRRASASSAHYPPVAAGTASARK